MLTDEQIRMTHDRAVSIAYLGNQEVDAKSFDMGEVLQALNDAPYSVAYLIREMAIELQQRRRAEAVGGAGAEERAYDEWQRTRDRLSDVTSLWFNEIRHVVPEGEWKRDRFNAAFRQAEALLCEPGPPAHSDRAGAARGGVTLSAEEA